LRVPLPPGPIFANKTTERNNFWKLSAALPFNKRPQIGNTKS
jgi:hypothetical protein